MMILSKYNDRRLVEAAEGKVMSDWRCCVCNLLMSEEPGPRKPCPDCGSTRRTMDASVAISAQASVHLLCKTKHREGGSKVVREVTDGHSLTRKTGEWNFLYRLIDWAKDLYHERITDAVTGEVIHEQAERLSEHRGHGSAKAQKTENPSDR